MSHCMPPLLPICCRGLVVERHDIEMRAIDCLVPTSVTCSVPTWSPSSCMPSCVLKMWPFGQLRAQSGTLRVRSELLGNRNRVWRRVFGCSPFEEFLSSAPVSDSALCPPFPSLVVRLLVFYRVTTKNWAHHGIRGLYTIRLPPPARRIACVVNFRSLRHTGPRPSFSLSSPSCAVSSVRSTASALVLWNAYVCRPLATLAKPTRKTNKTCSPLLAPPTTTTCSPSSTPSLAARAKPFPTTRPNFSTSITPNRFAKFGVAIR